MPDTLLEAAERLIATMPEGSTAASIRERARRRRRRRSMARISAVVILSICGLTAVHVVRSRPQDVVPTDSAPTPSTSTAPAPPSAPSTTERETTAPPSTIVNQPPIAVPDLVVIVGGASNTVRVTANDIDADGGRLHLVSVGGAVGGSASIDGETVRVTPDADFVGTLTFVYVVADEANATSSGTVTVIVTGPPNDEASLA